jgi:hypothetical protein
MASAALTAAMDRAVVSACLDFGLVFIDAHRGLTHVAPVSPVGALARYDRSATSRSICSRRMSP